MLSSISPFGERARNSRWWLTVLAYLVGSVAGGATTGLAFGVIGEAVERAVGADVRLLMMAFAALLAIVAELQLAGTRVPSLVRRQVNEDWLTTYRGWVYGAGFGFQLGLGIATIVASSTVWLTWLAATLAGSWAAGLTIGVVFGLARGSLILATVGVDDPELLRALFRRIARSAPAVQRVATLSVALTAMTAFGGTIGGLVS